MSLLGWIKLAAVFAVVGLIGYSYKWTFDRGGDVRMAQAKVDAVQVLVETLKKQEIEFRILRDREMREAADVSAKQRTNDLKRIKDLQALNKSTDACSNQLIPDSALSVLRAQRSGNTAAG